MTVSASLRDRKPTQHFINGMWTSSGDQTFASRNPFNGEVVSEIAAGGRAEASCCCRSCRAGLSPSGPKNSRWNVSASFSRPRTSWNAASPRLCSSSPPRRGRDRSLGRRKSTGQRAAAAGRQLRMRHVHG
jgi:hypothetical protein